MYNYNIKDIEFLYVYSRRKYMKIPKFLTIIIVNKMIQDSKRIIKKTPFKSEPSNVYDIYYTEKNIDSEAFDLYRRKIDSNKRITLIDIHGGAYAAGFRKSQFYFVRQFQDEGMDVLCPDYTHTGKDKNISVETQIKELVLFLNYLDEHFEELDNRIAMALCHLERLIPPAFFDVMVHLTIHLADEAKLAGPVQYRWMYPIERIVKLIYIYIYRFIYF